MCGYRHDPAAHVGVVRVSTVERLRPDRRPSRCTQRNTHQCKHVGLAKKRQSGGQNQADKYSESVTAASTLHCVVLFCLEQKRYITLIRGSSSISTKPAFMNVGVLSERDGRDGTS